MEKAAGSLKKPVVSPVLLAYRYGIEDFRVDSETMDMIESLKEPVAVVSVCGLGRQPEKSFILNQLLGGFGVGSIPDDDRIGIWLWKSPLLRTASDGTTYNLLVLDTGAVDDFYSMDTSNLPLICLVLVLSSTFIYKQMGGLGDVALRFLSFCIGITEQVCRQCSKGIKAFPTIQEFSSLLLLLQKNLHLELGENNYVGTSRDHLECFLERTFGTDEVSQDALAATKNKMRESIRGFFPDIYACTLPHPVTDADNLRQCDQRVLERLSPASRDDLATLGTFVLEKTRPKLVNDTGMTGFMFTGITQCFLYYFIVSPDPFYDQEATASDDIAFRIIVPPLEIHLETLCLRAIGFAVKTFMYMLEGINEIHAKYLEELLGGELVRSMELFGREVNGIVHEPLVNIYREFLKSDMRKEIEATKAKYVGRNLGNEGDDLTIVKFLGALADGYAANRSGAASHEEKNQSDSGGDHNHSVSVQELPSRNPLTTYNTTHGQLHNRRNRLVSASGHI